MVINPAIEFDFINRWWTAYDQGNAYKDLQETIHTHNLGAVEFKLNLYLSHGTIPIKVAGPIDMLQVGRDVEQTPVDNGELRLDEGRGGEETRSARKCQLITGKITQPICHQIICGVMDYGRDVTWEFSPIPTAGMRELNQNVNAPSMLAPTVPEWPEWPEFGRIPAIPTAFSEALVEKSPKYPQEIIT
ncbi:hypothetical protein B0J17DRAFT_632977 [Rhizoctonia solani]|nr:hypothetical protein B0J17DRAFT_632977 [Rhizoctonia solani]